MDCLKTIFRFYEIFYHNSSVWISEQTIQSFEMNMRRDISICTLSFNVFIKIYGSKQIVKQFFYLKFIAVNLSYRNLTGTVIGRCFGVESTKLNYSQDTQSIRSDDRQE